MTWSLDGAGTLPDLGRATMVGARLRIDARTRATTVAPPSCRSRQEVGIKTLLDLVVLAIAAGVVPFLVTVTLLLVRGPSSLGAAAGWVAGMVGVRLLQGVVFGLFLPGQPTINETGQSTVVATGMLILSVLLFAGAAWKAMTGGDAPAEGPAHRWMARLDRVTPGRAMVLGALAMLLGAREWVCTLGAIGSIASSSAGPVLSVGLFLLFTLLASALPIAIVGVAWIAPDRSASALDALAAWMRHHEDTIVIVVGVVFGTLLGVRALVDFGILA